MLSLNSQQKTEDKNTSQLQLIRILQAPFQYQSLLDTDALSSFKELSDNDTVCEEETSCKSESDSENNQGKPRLTLSFDSYEEFRMTYKKSEEYRNEECFLLSFVRKHKMLLKMKKEGIITFDVKRIESIMKFLYSDGIMDMFHIEMIPTFVKIALFNFPYTNLEFKCRVKGDIVKIDYTKDKYKDISAISSELMNQLYPFQIEGIKFAIDNRCRVILADEMLTGKRIQALALSQLYKKNWPVLIICSSSIKYQWRREISLWVPISNRNRIQLINSSNDIFKSNMDFYIVSFDKLKNIEEKVKRKHFNFVIIDECHFITSLTMKRYHTLISIAQQSKRLLLLSSTPIEQKLFTIFPMINCIRPDIFNSFPLFKRRYFSQNDSIELSIRNELNMVLNKVMFRRKKKDIVHQLPPKTRAKIEIECDEDVARLIKSNDNLAKKDFKITDLDKTNVGNRLYYLTALAKANGICNYIKGLLKYDYKYIIFAHHSFLLNRLEKIMKERNVGYIRIDNKEEEQMRDYIDKFQTDPQCRVAILNIVHNKITLKGADMIIVTELIFNSSLIIQAENACYDKSVDVVYLYGESTLDYYIFEELSENMKKEAKKRQDQQMYNDFRRMAEEDRREKTEEEVIYIDSDSEEEVIYISDSEDEMWKGDNCNTRSEKKRSRANLDDDTERKRMSEKIPLLVPKIENGIIN